VLLMHDVKAVTVKALPEILTTSTRRTPGSQVSQDADPDLVGARARSRTTAEGVRRWLAMRPRECARFRTWSRPSCLTMTPW